MTMITLEILFIVFLTAVNGLFAMSEIAVVSARRSRLQQWAEGGNRNARLVLDIAKSPEDFLSTVQVGITLVGVLAGAIGGVTIAQHLSGAIAANTMLGPYAGTIAVGIVVIAITYLSLILGELVPKRIALNDPEKIATAVVRPMRFLFRVVSPAVRFLSASTRAILWLFRVRPAAEQPVSEDEIRILIRQAADAGIIERGERDIVDRVFRLGTRRSSTIMTPRKDLVMFDVSESPGEILGKIEERGFSVYPLCDGSPDNVAGIVRPQDILTQVMRGKPADLKAAVRQPLFLPESVPTLKLLEEFRKTGKDTALLLDEHGGLAGLVTATDVLKAVLGEVSFMETPKAVRQADGTVLIDGMLPLDEFLAALGIADPEDKEFRAIETAGGFMMVILGRIPSENDVAAWGGHEFRVLDMDGLRVDKIVATPLANRP